MNNFVAIHTCPSRTNSGHYCTRFPNHLIVIGPNPVGPRGGNWVEGEIVACFKFGKRKNAYQYIQKLVNQGYQHI